MTSFEEKGKRLVHQVLSICTRADAGYGEAKASRAALRRALSPTMVNKATQYLVQWCDLTDEEGLLVTSNVAAYICFHPYHSPNCGNFGTVIRKLAYQRGTDADTFQRHFQRIAVAVSTPCLCDRVGRMIPMLKNTKIPVDYVQLYMDMLRWDKKMVLRWAEGYYAGQDTRNALDKEDQDVAE